jgi:hypothetical protein
MAAEFLHKFINENLIRKISIKKACRKGQAQATEDPPCVVRGKRLIFLDATGPSIKIGATCGSIQPDHRFTSMEKANQQFLAVHIAWLALRR